MSKEEITNEELKQLWASLDKIYWVLSDSDSEGFEQRNNIDYYPAKDEDDYFELVNYFKEVVEVAIGKSESRNLSVVAVVSK